MSFFENLWKAFSLLPEVDAIVLGGSRASGAEDTSSDYDLYVYCSSIPDCSVRERIISENCSYSEINNQFWETEDDCILKDGIDIDILYRNLNEFTEIVASSADHFQAHNGYTTCMWYNLINTIILYDPMHRYELLQRRFRIPYPKQLKTNIIQQNMRLLTGNLPSYDKQILKAAKRNDIISISHRTAAYIESYFDIIFAVNELLHPGEKRMISYAITHAKTLPADFEANLTGLFHDLYHHPEQISDDLKHITEELIRILPE